MPENIAILQRIINQHNERPDGLRIWSDGLVQRGADDNPPPGLTERLDKDREIKWQDVRQLTVVQVDAVRAAIRSSGIFHLEPILLINYCKEDPGTAIWTVDVDGESTRVVLWDPRPTRSAALDTLTQAIDKVLAS